MESFTETLDKDHKRIPDTIIAYCVLLHTTSASWQMTNLMKATIDDSDEYDNHNDVCTPTQAVKGVLHVSETHSFLR